MQNFCRPAYFMKFINLFILFFISVLFARAQTNFNGIVLDSLSGKPVPGATISIPLKNLFYPANNNGVFTISNSNTKSTDSLYISCVGYRTKKITVRNLLSKKEIYLSLNAINLSEVIIGSSTVAKIGSKSKSGNVNYAYGPGTEEAVFMEESVHKRGIIQSVGFYLGKGPLFSKGVGDVTAPFRIKLYKVDTAGMPGAQLIDDIIVVRANKNNHWFDVNLYQYQIENPDDGFFVAFVMLDANYYQMGRANWNTIDGLYAITPNLGYTEGKLEKALSYLGVYTSWGFEWHKQVENITFMVRATIVQ